MTLSAQVDYQREEYGPHVKEPEHLDLGNTLGLSSLRINPKVDWKALSVRCAKRIEEYQKVFKMLGYDEETVENMLKSVRENA